MGREMLVERVVADRPGYSPVRADPSGRVDVELATDHPGTTDLVYRARRNRLASLALSWVPGRPIPSVDYSTAEVEVWKMVSAALEARHDELACASFLHAKAALGLPADDVPQLDDVSAVLGPLTGFRYEPVAGLAPLRQFYANFADGVFASTQYLRHPSVPLYTPEPDLIHEVIGHAHHLAAPAFADLYRLVGAATNRVRTDDALRFLSRVFWFTLEFGVVREAGQWKAYGAGILSSAGELDRFRTAEIRPVDFSAMGTAAYDISHYQPVLYGFDSEQELFAELAGFFAGFDDAQARALS
ncbi:MAG: hypothetical protein NVS1B12_01360 [Acidimicrobiales bacterium]